MMFVVEIHWDRRVPDPELEPSGKTVYVEYCRTINAAITKAKTKFRRHYGMHRSITRAAEQAPAKSNA